MDHDVVKHPMEHMSTECTYVLVQDSKVDDGTCRAPAVKVIEENEGFRWTGRCAAHKDL